MVQINIQCVQSTDYTMLSLINDLCRFQYSDGIKICIWCDKSFVPTGLSCKLDFVIKGHRTIGFAGKAKSGASVGIPCLDIQCRKSNCCFKEGPDYQRFFSG